MEWSELLQTASSFHVAHDVRLIIVGAPKDSMNQLKGDDPCVVTYNYQDLVVDDDTLGSLSVFAVATPSGDLIEPLLGSEKTVIIICLDWLQDLSQWPAQLAASLAAIAPPSSSTESEALTPSPALIFCLTHYTELLAKRYSAVFDEKVDFAQQWLRAQAIKQRAAVVTDGPDVEWMRIIATELGLVSTSATNFEPKVVDGLLLPAGWDSQEKVLAVGNFPYEEAVAGTLELSSLDTNNSVAAILQPETVEERDFDAILAKAAVARSDATLSRSETLKGWITLI